ncbi:MAG: Crp/Fnr family transcriptional regulator [Acidobacteriota bacterium]
MALTIVDKARLLHGAPLFSEVPTEILADLAALTTVQQSTERTTLFRQGEPADSFYFVIAGTVRALCNEEEVYRAGPGEEVGALAVLDHQPRAFSAVADESCNLLRVGAEDFLDLLEQHPALARGVIRHLAQELRRAAGGDSSHRAR